MYTKFRNSICGIFIAILLIADGTVGFAAPPGLGPLDANVVNTPDVNVVNTPANPVPTQPGGQPVQAQLSKDCGFNSCSGTLYTVPEGKLLIIEQIGARTDTPDPNDLFSVALRTELDDVSVSHELGMLEKHPGSTGNAQHQGGFPVSLYAGPGTDVTIFVSLGESFADIDFLLANLSGRLVDY